MLNQFCYGKAISVTYSDCVSVVLFVQHENCMRRIILSSVVGMDLPYFSTLSHNVARRLKRRWPSDLHTVIGD